MPMHNPPHPGEVIRDLCLEPLGLTVTAAAKALGVSRRTLSELLNGRRGISAEMAVRLSLGFGRSPEAWLAMQADHDLAQVLPKVKKLGIDRLQAA
ncbi:MAG: HigA family addiction module antidote protein [Nitrospirae bacterium]|nr:HigA family addiction module antidote protein [Nitrospirota bacterium]